MYYFNPRSHERSDYSNHASTNMSDDFNPRSHERSDKAQNYLKRYYIISIHAPTRGATKELKAELKIINISIHAPTRGATAKGTKDRIKALFQSTLPREERPKVLSLTTIAQ